MAQMRRLVSAAVLVSLSFLASPVRSEKAEPVTRLEQIAGTYALGRGLGFNFRLTINPQGTFSYVWMGCMGTYAEAKGKAFLRDGELVLKPPFLKGETDKRFKTHFLPILWGDRHYLIPPDELLQFAKQVHSGREPRNSSFGDAYLKQDDWDIPVTGAPDLPKGHQASFRK